MCFNFIKQELHCKSLGLTIRLFCVQISNPDEFDIMISIPVDRVEVTPFGETGAFYSVSLKRGNSPLRKFQLQNNILSASQVLKEFREEVKKSIKGITGWCHHGIFSVWVKLFCLNQFWNYNAFLTMSRAGMINEMFCSFCLYQDGRCKQRELGVLQ